jgi:hypothetical protein
VEVNQDIQNFLIRAVLNRPELEDKVARLKSSLHIQTQLFGGTTIRYGTTRSQLDAVQRILFAISHPYVMITSMVEIDGGYPTHTLVFDSKTEVRYLLTI